MYLKFAENVDILVPIVNVYWVQKMGEFFFQLFQEPVFRCCVSNTTCVTVQHPNCYCLLSGLLAAKYRRLFTMHQLWGSVVVLTNVIVEIWV